MHLWTAFMIGLAGSVHCVGMCGAIALALPTAPGAGRAWQVSAAYNIGRILTYSVLGLLLGLIGQGLHVIGYQQRYSVVMGVILLLIALFSINVEHQIVRLPGISAGYVHLKSALARHLQRQQRHPLRTAAMIGMLNGWLPCGLVYMALAGAIAQPVAWQGAAYMAVFGLGTFPLMLATAWAGRLLSFKWRGYLQRFSRALVLGFAVLMILRGLNLGIPYVSPRVINQTEDVRCH